MRIDQDILNIIDSGHSEDNIYFLPNVQLDRKDYMKVNKVLTALGGKWNRKSKGHIFDMSIDDKIDNVILTGEVVDKKKELQFFETPEKIAEMLCDLADVENANTVLEPSAGKGSILKVINRLNPDANIFWFELDEENAEFTKSLNIAISKIMGFSMQLGYDFMVDFTLDDDQLFDCVIMNPPFSKQQDIDHVTHALEFLKDGGTLVSVMSPSIKFRTNKKTKEFLDLIGKYDYDIIDLPEGSFKESGTMINTIILKITKG